MVTFKFSEPEALVVNLAILHKLRQHKSTSDSFALAQVHSSTWHLKRALLVVTGNNNPTLAEIDRVDPDEYV